MSTRDNSGLQMSAAAAETGRKYDNALAELALWRNPIALLNRATEDDPNFVMGHVFKAYMDMVSTDRRYATVAAQRIETIDDICSTHGCLPREALHLEALRQWQAGDGFAASRVFDTLLSGYPTDFLALWMAHQLDFYLGQSNRIRDRIAEAMPHWDTAHGLYSFVLGMHAFGLEEAGETGRALEVGLAALERDTRDVWSIHAVAHAYEMSGEFNTGANFMETTQQTWSENNFLTSHNAIHTILYRLEQKDLPNVLRLYDSYVQPEGKKPALLGLVDGSSALWRLYLEDTDAGHRWKHLAAHWEPAADQGFCALNDVHAMMAFVAADNHAAADRLMAALDRAIAEDGPQSRTNTAVTATVGRPICASLQAFGRKNYSAVVDGLLPIRDQIIRFGGSHAQRDVVERTLLEAAIRDHQKTLAQRLIEARLIQRPNSTYNRQKSAQIAAMA